MLVGPRSWILVLERASAGCAAAFPHVHTGLERPGAGLRATAPRLTGSLRFVPADAGEARQVIHGNSTAKTSCARRGVRGARYDRHTASPALHDRICFVFNVSYRALLISLASSEILGVAMKSDEKKRAARKRGGL